MIEIITSFFFVVIFPPGNFVQPIGCPGSPAHSVVGWLRLKLVDLVAVHVRKVWL